MNACSFLNEQKFDFSFIRMPHRDGRKHKPCARFRREIEWNGCLLVILLLSPSVCASRSRTKRKSLERILLAAIYCEHIFVIYRCIDCIDSNRIAFTSFRVFFCSLLNWNSSNGGEEWICFCGKNSQELNRHAQSQWMCLPGKRERVFTADMSCRLASQDIVRRDGGTDGEAAQTIEDNDFIWGNISWIGPISRWN